ncbi:hypothetical protein MMC32_007330 [Xylographa parallela]|nr:hypothetical protein [Xylographa parallela]
MSDDEADLELLALLRKSLGLDSQDCASTTELPVLKDAEFIYDNSIDVAIDYAGTKAAAATIWSSMQKKGYSRKTWSEHDLHPKTKDESTANFIFTMDLLNFCFWPEGSFEIGYTVNYRGERWTGYWSLVAVLQRALDDDIPITDSHFWQDESECTEEVLQHVFRSDSATSMPLLNERMACLREAGTVLYNRFDCSFLNCLREANHSATALVNILADMFPCFRDETRFEGKTVHFYKRAQILVADLWACFDGEGYGRFDDIDKITMFADYRIPQMLNSLGCLQYSPPLHYHIKKLRQIDSGHPWEVQLRGCSIWCVELIRREIVRCNARAHVNAILIDFFLYDTVKEQEAHDMELLAHHRTKGIWY